MATMVSKEHATKEATMSLERGLLPMAMSESVALPQTRSLLISMIPDTTKSNVDARARGSQCHGDHACVTRWEGPGC